MISISLRLMRRYLPKHFVYHIRSAFFSVCYMVTKPERTLKNPASPNRIILINTPEHDNLGDHAIAAAETALIRDQLPEYCVAEITHHCWLARKSQLLRYISKRDIIAINGGGYLGSLWSHNDKMIRDVVNAFPDNRIFFFPQTIFYEDFSEDCQDFALTKTCFKGHKNLVMCLRDQKSYYFVMKHFDGCFRECILTPDIVLYLKDSAGACRRDGILLCLRTDKERVIDDTLIGRLESYAAKTGIQIAHTNTVIGNVVFPSDREKALKKKLNEFKKAQIVITDRLHGMIFAAITSTPCIALDNISSKVGGVYRWIEYLDYIAFAQNVEELGELIDMLLQQKESCYSNKALMPHFERLAKALINTSGVSNG